MRKLLTNALALLLEEDPLFYTLPVNTQVVAIAWFKNMKKVKGGAFLNEALVRLEGHVPKVIMTELPAIDITFEETPRLITAGVSASPGTGAEGTTLPRSDGSESMVEAEEAHTSTVESMPVLVRKPPVDGVPFKEFHEHAKAKDELKTSEPSDFNLMDEEDEDVESDGA